MTDERKEQFAAVVFKDVQTAKKYLAMSPENVASDLKSNGYDFSVDEIKAIGDEILEANKQMESSELSPEDLDAVAGGISWFKAGVGVGILVGIGIMGW